MGKKFHIHLTDYFDSFESFDFFTISHFPRYHRSRRLSSLIEHIVSFICHIIYMDDVRAIALSLGTVFLSIEHIVDVEHIRLVTLGHCPVDRNTVRNTGSLS